MRVFLCGAQGVGKSTLVTSLPSEFGLEIKDSFSRKFLEKNPDIQNSTNVDFNEFQDKILLYCLDQYVNDKDFISSRSIIDSYAYLSVCKPEEDVMLKNILGHYMDYVTTEDCIYIYIPIEFQISGGNNDLRNTDSEYQRNIDQQMQKFFNKLKRHSKGADFHIITGDRETRLEKLKTIIKEKKECLK